jgi:hypothetical protein
MIIQQGFFYTGVNILFLFYKHIPTPPPPAGTGVRNNFVTDSVRTFTHTVEIVATHLFDLVDDYLSITIVGMIRCILMDTKANELVIHGFHMPSDGGPADPLPTGVM